MKKTVNINKNNNMKLRLIIGLICITLSSIRSSALPSIETGPYQDAPELSCLINASEINCKTSDNGKTCVSFITYETQKRKIVTGQIVNSVYVSSPRGGGPIYGMIAMLTLGMSIVLQQGYHFLEVELSDASDDLENFIHTLPKCN